MSSDPDDWPRVRELFERALGRSASERAAYLAAACGGDRALRDEVERMLGSHQRAAGFLSAPAAAMLDASALSLEGQKFGPYQLGARIGAGGMGEVYKARDTRLDRTVAIKVLPPEVANDPHARERFVREGRAIAALSHPNICALYDVGDTTASTPGSPFYLVMEYLEGETLVDRLARGALPMAQALQIGAQMASALDKAHHAGIVHRDLKPGNVFLVRSGASATPTAKLLDFGLAKSAASRTVDLATRHAIAANLTAPGTIIGTVQYMAPEQVEGKEVDARTDIFALGTVLHEMLTGTKAFAGKSQASLTVAILEHEPPPVSSLLPSASPALDRVVARCLAKDPDERWQSARDLASELQWLAQGGAAPAASRFTRGVRAQLIAVALATLAAVTAVGAWFALRRPSQPVAATTKQFTVTAQIVLEGYVGRRLAIVPDGSGFVYPSGGSGSRDYRWMLHRFADGVSHPLPQTEGAYDPFFSPDGKWLAFFQENRLKKVAMSGGPALDICESAGSGSGSWGPGDQIVFAGQDGLWRVSALGGNAERLTALAPSESAHDYPEILPRGDTVLFTTRSKTGAAADATVSVVSTRGGEFRTLIRGATVARYAPTGHVLYVRGSDLLAVAFDPERLAITGNPVRVVDNLETTQQMLAAQYDFAVDGTLAFITGGEPQRSLVWADRDGTLRPLPVRPGPYAHPALMPDGQGLIIEVERNPHDLWRYDFRSGALTRLTFEGGNHHAVLSPDGRLMAFASDRSAPRNLFVQPTDGSGPAERLYEAPYSQTSNSWSRDGRWLAFAQLHPQTQSDIWILEMTGERRARPFLATRYNEQSAAFSPDSHWMAYVSNESGQNEILIMAFPGPGAHKQVSTNGGEVPLFSDDGRTLYYKAGTRIMAVDLASEPAMTTSAPRVAFETPGGMRVTVLPFPVTPKGDSVLYVREPDNSVRDVQVKVNWFEELRRITAVK